MKTVLHIGAHRTATTTFQRYMQNHSDALHAQQVLFWGPKRTRNGLLSGVLPGLRPGYARNAPARARGRIQLSLDRAQDTGAQTLVISDENLIGSTRACLKAHKLYPAIGERMSHYNAAFDGRVDEVILTVRSLDVWWRSALAYAVTRGAPLAGAADCAAIASGARSWRAVIEDLACALPGATLRVVAFEHVMGQPGNLLHLATGLPDAASGPVDRLNRAPDTTLLRQILKSRGADLTELPAQNTPWTPFNPAQEATLRQNYADDLHWLSTGADGLAVLTEDPQRKARHKRKTLGQLKDRGRPKHVTKVGTLAQSGSDGTARQIAR